MLLNEASKATLNMSKFSAFCDVITVTTMTSKSNGLKGRNKRELVSVRFGSSRTIKKRY